MRLALRLQLLNGDKLAGYEWEFTFAVDCELEMFGLLGQKDRTGKAGGQELALTRFPDGCIRGLSLNSCANNWIEITHNI